MAGNNITWETIDPKVRNVTMVGLAFAMLIACFDGTIVGTCGYVIANGFNATDLYAWMITAYMLCETIMIPISGKMSDHYGRKPLFLLGLGLFVGGSLLAGMSTSMEMFILCRAIQGLGGGTLIPVAMAAVGDFYSPEARGKIQGVLGAVFGVGSAIGPLLGGYITEYVGVIEFSMPFFNDIYIVIDSWRWVFYINIPLAIIALALTLKEFPKANVDVLHKVDYLGMAVLSAFLIDLLLFIQWGGDEIAWVSIESVLMVAAAIGLLALFIKIECIADDPVLAPHLFKNHTIVACAAFMMIFGIGMMGAMTYSSLFNVYIFGLSPLEAGEISIALVAGMMITSLSSGALVDRTGYKPWLIVGPIVTASALIFMSTLHYGSDLMEMVFALFLLGAGLGCMMSVVMVAAQNSAKPGEMGMTTSSVNLMRSIGSTAGTAVFAMIISQVISSQLMENVSPAMYALIPHSTAVLDELGNIMVAFGQTGVDQVLTSFANSVDVAFLIGGVIMLALVVVGLFIRSKHKGVEIPVSVEEILSDEKEE